jgi:hypothetical protein
MAPIFPPGPQRVLTPFYDPLVLKSGHALSQCSCAESGVRVGEWEGPGWNMILQDVQGIERRTRERAMTGRKERAIMINLTNARYVPNMEGGTMIGNTDPPPNSMSLAGSAQVLAWGKSRRNRSAHESFSGEGADPQVSRSWTSSTMSKKG